MLDVIGAGALGAGMIVLIRRRRSRYLQACGVILRQRGRAGIKPRWPHYCKCILSIPSRPANWRKPWVNVANVLADKVVVANARYRRDIGTRLIEGEFAKIEALELLDL
jgi:hypothetical protein